MASMVLRLTLVFVLSLVCVHEVTGHGRLRVPPSRSTMWRYGFRSPPNYNDHELNCGGFSAHWGLNKGRCGVCGDNFQDPQPRANERGGTYGHGPNVKEYSQGEIIETEVEVTANHKGFFEFSICPHNDPRTPASEECFQLLEMADGSGTRWQLYDDVTPKTYTISLKLPAEMTCTQCVFRWYWKSGNNWGTENGQSGLGYGAQETFMACSDVAILSGENKPISSDGGRTQPFPGRRPLVGRPRPITTTTTTPPTTTTQYRRRIYNDNEDNDNDDDWSEFDNGRDSDSQDRHPEVAFAASPTDREVQPPCRAFGIWSQVDGMDNWCVTNCAMNFCPLSHCCCGC